MLWGCRHALFRNGINSTAEVGYAVLLPPAVGVQNDSERNGALYNSALFFQQPAATQPLSPNLPHAEQRGHCLRLEDQVDLGAIGAPSLQLVLGDGALQGRALVLLLVELEVRALDPILVEAELLAAALNDLVARLLLAHHHASPRTDGRIRHEDLNPPSLRGEARATNGGLLRRSGESGRQARPEQAERGSKDDKAQDRTARHLSRRRGGVRLESAAGPASGWTKILSQ